MASLVLRFRKTLQQVSHGPELEYLPAETTYCWKPAARHRIPSTYWETELWLGQGSPSGSFPNNRRLYSRDPLYRQEFTSPKLAILVFVLSPDYSCYMIYVELMVVACPA